ncbi:glycosyltransferase family 4 protein [Aestuariivivens sediminis]|uniref:glycosyltransferase family 4 protein n=1 Tax=Aestuariivivens sediminis TaxID=2913557 RepID=UPI001F5ACA73|nr:glycosyltransferase family 4 protein [Aestuariivivens sediminis]
MTSKPAVAIYSGDIPGTTFIERLVLGLALSGQRVYRFGFLKAPVAYPKTVKVVGYRNTKIGKGLHLLQYTLLLILFRYKDKRQLDKFLKETATHLTRAKVKAYPVLWHRPEVFHVQWAKDLNNWMWVQSFGMKLVLSLRGAHINYSPIANDKLAAMYRAHFPKVDGFHAVSKAIAQEAEGYGALKARIAVVYSGLNLEALEAEKLDGSSVFEMVSVGRSHWIKGYHYALDACKQLKHAGIPFKYTIIGAAHDIELLYQIKDLGLEDEVVLLKHTPFDRVQLLIRKASVLLLPSLKEGIANVVLEAMSLRTLVLSTDCGGMGEVINDGVNGFLVPIRNPKAIADKLIEIRALSNESKKQISNKAYNTVTEQHQLEQMVKGMQALYGDVLHNNGKGHHG